jgi:hypothetical protein
VQSRKDDKTQPFQAVLSASSGGLGILVASDAFAVSLPWARATVSGKRSWPATVIRILTEAGPSVILVFNLDDAADDLLPDVVEALEVQVPQRRLTCCATCIASSGCHSQPPLGC